MRVILLRSVSRRALLAAALLSVSSPGKAHSQDLAIAAASDLQAVLPAISARFERQTGVSVRLTFGSSGNFFSQLQNGAPFDVFLSADLDYPDRLIAAGVGVRDSLYEYATGRIVVWARNDAGLDLRRGLHTLADARVRRIAIANPEHAPYGRAAVAALQHEHLYEGARPKLVLGENISQAAQFVQSGNADVGILALSLALAPALRPSGVYVEIPSAFHAPIRQAAIIVRASQHQASARQFLEFMKRPDIVQLMIAAGFAPVERGLR